jgi:uncharacterized protein YjcR
VTAPPILLDTAEEVARWLHVSPHTIRSWARRSYITRYPGDRYSAIEAADYLDSRSDLNTRRARRTRRAGASSPNCVS